LSSDGGILVLREVEQRLHVADRLAACIEDPHHDRHAQCTINAQVGAAANCSEVLFRRRKRWVEPHRVAFGGAMDRRRHNDARVEINGVLQFVREMRRAVLRIGLARAILVRQLLALALAVKLDEVVDRRRLDAALLSHPRQHFAIVSPMSRRSIDRSAARTSIVEPSTPIVSPFTRPRSATSFKMNSNILMTFIWQSAACLRQPGMVGNLVPAPKSQEIPKRP
jgi:hypothetical protein